MNNYKDENYIKSMGVDFRLPKHVGIIMDGNGRWAKKRLLPRNAGHKEGVKRLKSIVNSTGRLGIDSLTVYAFSTENWNRSDEEVTGLMKLLAEAFTRLIDELVEQHVRVVHIGETDRLDANVVEILDEAQRRTAENDGLTFNIAFNYGSRREMLSAVKRIAADVKNGAISENDITEQMISDRLYTAGQADPDVIIRTSGESRLSNFMLYQAAYSELVVVNDLWPDFSDIRYVETLREFSKRDRRFGGVNK